MDSRLSCCVVGAGFAGAVMARVLADQGVRVLLVEKRSHVGGNAYDEYDANGVLVHTYGPHIFHTSSQDVIDFLSRFTSWRAYQHRVRAWVGKKHVPIPVNRTTLNLLYELDLQTDEAAESFLAGVRDSDRPINTSEDVVMSRVGEDLCEKLFRGYTRKQWGRDLSELAPEVAGRVPVRTNEDDRYFTDSFQFMPAEGFTVMFERMLDHPEIEVLTGQDYFEIRGELVHDHTVFTGRLDHFFDFRFGRLPYRSLRFDHQHREGVEFHQPVAVMNYPNDQEYTRVTEFKHMTGQVIEGTSIVYEFAMEDGDPYYPVPSPEAKALANRYRELARTRSDVTFLGRLAQYRYFNMDHVVAAALKKSQGVLATLGVGCGVKRAAGGGQS